MRYLDVRDLIRSTPFRPFRLKLTDGSTYDVKHPEFCMPTLGAVHIGIPSAADTEAVEHVQIVSLYHIVKAEYLGPAPEFDASLPGGPQANGTHPKE